MDVKTVYPQGPYRIVLGFSDSEQEHFARIETDTDTPEVQWAYETPIWTRGYPVLQMLAATQIAARDIIGIEQFEVDDYDLDQLLQAPNSRQVDPSTLQPLHMLDTDYAKAPIYGDDAPNETLEAAIEGSLAELQTCVSCLTGYLEPATQGKEPVSHETVDRRCNSAITFTACEMVRLNEILNEQFSHTRIDAIARASESPTASIHDIFTPQEIERINTVTVSLCGSKLTDFRQAIEERGYDPVTGLPLGCPNPSTFRWADTVEDDAMGLYVGYGLSAEEAGRMVDIHRTDPRYRTDDDWEFLQTTAQNLEVEAHQRAAERMEG